MFCMDLQFSIRMNSALNHDDLLCPDIFIEDPMLTDLFPIGVAPPLQSIPEFNSITDRLESLEIAMNTQSLRIEIERTKRQKLRASLRQIKADLAYPSPEIHSLQQALEFNYAQQNTTNFQLGGEIDRTHTLAFRCFARVHQLLERMFSYHDVFPTEYNEISRMLYELSGTLHQFGVDHQVSYV